MRRCRSAGRTGQGGAGGVRHYAVFCREEQQRPYGGDCGTGLSCPGPLHQLKWLHLERRNGVLRGPAGVDYDPVQKTKPTGARQQLDPSTFQAAFLDKDCRQVGNSTPDRLVFVVRPASYSGAPRRAIQNRELRAVSGSAGSHRPHEHRQLRWNQPSAHS